MSKRIKKIQKLLVAKKAQACVVSAPKNIFYFSGFMPGSDPYEREALLLISRTRAQLFVSPLSVEVAQKETRVVCVSARKGLYHGVVHKIRAGQKVFFEEYDLRVQELDFLKKNTSAQWRGCGDLLINERIIKEDFEIKKLRSVCTITDRVFEKTCQFLKRVDYTKTTEKELAEKILAWGRELGADVSLEWAFAPIVATGAHSAVPHHVITDKKFKKNAPLLLDFGFRKDGYNSDMTRTVFLGAPTQKFVQMYNLVLQANEECTMMVMAGVSGAQLHEHAVEIFRRHGLEKNFVHALGHGLGLDVHELPHVSPRGKTELHKGEVITIEPGLYFDKKWGIRIEDDMMVNSGGAEVLTRSNRKLIVL